MTIGAAIFPVRTSSSIRAPNAARSPYPSQHTRAGRPWNGTRSSASPIHRRRDRSSGKRSSTARSVARMSLGSPDSATQRNGPFPRSNSGRM